MGRKIAGSTVGQRSARSETTMDSAELSRDAAELRRECYSLVRDVFGVPPATIDRIIRDSGITLPPIEELMLQTQPAPMARPKVDLPTRDDFLIFQLTPATDLKEGEEECPICIKPLDKPVRTPCGHVFCAFCLTKWLQDHTSCPIDRKELYTSTIPTNAQDDDDDDLTHRFHDLAIEPFNDRTDLAFHFHNEVIIDFTIQFDHYTHLRDDHGTDLYASLPAEVKVRIDVDAIRPIVLGATYRLASAPVINTADIWRSMIHGLCRREWLEVVHCIDRFLRSMDDVVLSKKDFEGQLKSRLAGFPRWKGKKGWSWATDRFEDDVAICGFEGKLEELRKWIVWGAVTRMVEEECLCESESEDEEDMPGLI